MHIVPRNYTPTYSRALMDPDRLKRWVSKRKRFDKFCREIAQRDGAKIVRQLPAKLAGVYYSTHVILTMNEKGELVAVLQ